MKAYGNKWSIWLMLLLTGLVQSPLFAQQADALSLSRRVADKIIADTKFEWKWVLQKDELGMQVIDFRFLFLQNKQNAYALKHVEVKADTLVKFGITSAGNIKVWINKKLAWEQQEEKVSNPVEAAYNRFRFSHYFSVNLKKGRNDLLIAYTNSGANPVVFLRPVTSLGDLDQSVSFTDTQAMPWLYAGPFNESVNTPLQSIQPYYQDNGKSINWETAPQRVLPELVIDSQAAYQRDPYADWQYSHGTMVWSILALDKETKAHDYLPFVKKYTGFILDHFDYIKWQYDSLYAWRGSYHRIFRRSMLDDAGAPALSFAGLYVEEKDSAIGKFLQPLIDYVSDKQVRLPDSTFCRPEPQELTVWADDLFMSVPFLVRMAKATGEKKYLEDAVRQVIQFRKYLVNPQTGLYKHGWFSSSSQQSVAYWGRANGWVAWATAELLDWLPANHPAYKQIQEAFRQHMTALVKYQAANGFWHQVLTRPDSYEETSCTAMFALAMARGVRKGWLNKSFKQPALKAWNAVAGKIEANGVVQGICRGTEIGFDEQFYFDRKTIDNDPRGLGAVISAGIEISKLP
jgi:unsaturated rhamnogalacturonyl hydrolase